MKNHNVLSVFRCVEGAIAVASRGTPKSKNGAPRDELKNGRGRAWAGRPLKRPWVSLVGPCLWFICLGGPSWGVHADLVTSEIFECKEFSVC